MITLITDYHDRHRRPGQPGEAASPATLFSPASPPAQLGRGRCRRRSRRRCCTAWPGSRSTSSPAPAASPPRCAAPCWAPSSTARASPSTPATPTRSPPPSATPSSAATSTAPGPPAATAPPPSPTSTTSQHKKDGGPTSVKHCLLLCQYHHDICIHRWGWKIELLPDGSVRATGPQGQIIQSHPPPTASPPRNPHPNPRPTTPRPRARDRKPPRRRGRPHAPSRGIRPPHGPAGPPCSWQPRGRDTDPQRYDREIKQARSLLFVAATRASGLAGGLLAWRAKSPSAAPGPGITSTLWRRGSRSSDAPRGRS